MTVRLKTNPLKRSDLDEFVACYNRSNRHARTATWSEATPEGRWRSYPYEELVQRDKCLLDIFWLRDESLEDSQNLPAPDLIAAEIIEDLRAALEQFAEIQSDLSRSPGLTEGYLFGRSDLRIEAMAARRDHNYIESR